ncbi:MAG: 2OG-Fe(II) oxygenase [Actinomycetota bacterium]
MSTDQLEKARALELPTRDAMLRRDASVQRFWLDNRELLADAWQQWEPTVEAPLAALDDSLIAAPLRTAVDAAWADPSTESAVRDLWTEVAPGVFEAQFFDPERLADLRTYLSEAEEAEIPMRPPYGIVLNRGGAMLDRRSQGYLAAPAFQTLYQTMLDRYMRPISRLLFPEIVGYDTQTFGFSINYQPGTDTSIRPHTDASAVTLNINMNLPDEDFAGSAVHFFDQATGQSTPLTFAPGTAMIHRGGIPHAAEPITDGARSNLVLWLYGDRGQVPMIDIPRTELDARQRWSIPSTHADDFAPF